MREHVAKLIYNKRECCTKCHSRTFVSNVLRLCTKDEMQGAEDEVEGSVLSYVTETEFRKQRSRSPSCNSLSIGIGRGRSGDRCAEPRHRKAVDPEVLISAADGGSRQGSPLDSHRSSHDSGDDLWTDQRLDLDPPCGSHRMHMAPSATPTGSRTYRSVNPCDTLPGSWDGLQRPVHGSSGLRPSTGG